ncbi:hypothetical protein LRH25_10140 [Ideonella azotifigens]|uniref:Ig-like domain-containing protein n=1 Tax=Ideonella azotifigens TaxID=513160 RepID=A0ABN1KEJ2_9BURK|nr:hypothetical protein [Ideonella azotifigens]MCD2340704.1 hypothetical protein [Ideonella azotifigens]
MFDTLRLALIIAHALRRFAAASASLLLASFFALFLAACGGSADAPPPGSSPAGGPQPPQITQQPADLSVTAGQPASFTVAATGSDPLSYQWQRDGSDIVGATSATYSLATTATTDTGAVFRAVVSNVAGSATSNNAALTVTGVPPVLTITQQPADASVVAGSSASFTVGATCSSGTLGVQWERASGSGFAAIAGATALTYTFTSATADNGAQFRTTLDCSGQSATASNAATLSVGTAGGITVGLLNIANRAAQAGVSQLRGVDALPDGPTVYTSANNIIKLSADRASITVVAGTQGTPGSTDGPGATALFSTPTSIVHDASGALWVLDTGNSAVRRIATDGTVTTVARGLTSPSAMALGPDGNFYISVQGFIVRMTPAGVVSNYAGSGNYGYLDGPAATADIGDVRGMAIAANGDLYFSQWSSSVVRRVERSGNVAGNVETVAGIRNDTTVPGVDGVGIAAGIPGPTGLAISGTKLYVRDTSLIRAIDLGTFAVTTFSGNRTGPLRLKDGPAAESNFDAPANGGANVLVALPAGGFMLGDGLAIRTSDAAGTITTIASSFNQIIAPGGTAVTDKLPFAAGNLPVSLAVDGQHRVVVGTDLGMFVRRIDTAGNLEILAGNPASDDNFPADGVGNAAALRTPGTSIAAAPDGTVYFSDYLSVRRVALDKTVKTIAGGYYLDSTTDIDGPTGTSRLLGVPSSMTIGIDGSVFFSIGRTTIRRVDAAGNTTTVAGRDGTTTSVDGPLATATFTGVGAMVTAPDGTMYVADGPVIRKITPAGIVSTLHSAALVKAMALDPSTGLLYVTLVQGDGISVVDPVADTAHVLIRSGSALVTGNVEPRVGAVRTLAMLGPKQIVICTDIDVLAVVTLP